MAQIYFSDSSLSFASLPAEYLTKGGHYKPTGCIPRQRLAVIVPYRERARHLTVFLSYMHHFLQCQGLEYVIYIVEMVSLGFSEPLLLKQYFISIVQIVFSGPLGQMTSSSVIPNIQYH